MVWSASFAGQETVKAKEPGEIKQFPKKRLEKGVPPRQESGAGECPSGNHQVRGDHLGKG